MKVFRSLDEAHASGAVRGCAVAIGNFDGVHLGHQRLLALARTRASSRGALSVALTFEPHPVRVLRPKLAPPLVTSLPRKLELLAEVGVGATVVQPFDLAYASTPADVFVSRDLADRLGCAEAVVGHDFTAGHERARVESLRPMLAARGILLHVVDAVTADGLVVSSTKIREFLLEGNVEAAALLLTRPYDMEGVVAHGAGRGHDFGFPTANVETTALLPANGVYVVRATVGGRVYGGVCNVGVKPTVETGAKVVAEAHLFDFDGRDVHGDPIRVAFLTRLREERRFPSIDELKAQIARDVERAKAVLRGSPGSLM